MTLNFTSLSRVFQSYKTMRGWYYERLVTVNKLPPSVGLTPGPLSQQASAKPTELPELLHIDQSSFSQMHLSSDAKDFFAFRTCYKCHFHFSCTCTAQLDPDHTVCDDPKLSVGTGATVLKFKGFLFEQSMISLCLWAWWFMLSFIIRLMFYFVSQQRTANISENFTCTVLPNFVLCWHLLIMGLWSAAQLIMGLWRLAEFDSHRRRNSSYRKRAPMRAEFHYRFNNMPILSDISWTSHSRQ